MAFDFCPRCGTRQQPDNVFCPQCGKRVGADEQPLPADVAERKDVLPADLLVQLRLAEREMTEQSRRRGLYGCLTVAVAFVLVALLAAWAGSGAPGR